MLNVGKFGDKVNSQEANNIFFYEQRPLVAKALLLSSSRSHSDTLHSVGFLWTSDRPVTGSFAWQHTTLRRDRHPSITRWDSNSLSLQASGSRLIH